MNKIIYNYLSFCSYPKKIEKNKINYNINYNIAKKHFSDQVNCPVCQSNSLKTKLREQSLGIFKDNNKNDIRQMKYRNKMYSKIYNKKNMKKYNQIYKNFSNSKIQQYQKKFCFFNATKGITKSKSIEEINQLFLIY